MISEHSVMQHIRLAIGGRPDVRVFRNNVAMAWIGKALRPSKTITVTVSPGDVVIFGARPLHAGLCDGSPDLVGWRSVVITQAHVGRRIASFLGLEVKTSTGRTSPQQGVFLGVLRAAGGLGGVVRSPEEALRIIDGI